MAYAEKIIAFVDILGFKELIKESESEAGAKARVHSSLLNMKENISGWLPPNPGNKRFFNFSDCIVLTDNNASKIGTIELLKLVNKIQADLASHGILLRGGITVGQVFDNYGLLYGPGVVEAYILESKSALFPRVVVDKKVLASHDIWKEVPLLQDYDQHIFLDYLWSSITLSHDLAYYGKIHRCIYDNLRNNKIRSDQKLYEKYHWMRMYYNYTVSRLQKVDSVNFGKLLSLKEPSPSRNKPRFR